MSQEPIVFLPNLYVNGLNLAYATTTTLTINTGQCRDSSNVYDMVNASALTLNLAIQGLGGIDTGTVAASTLYWVFLIMDTQGFNPVGCIFSLSSTAPLMPYGYGAIRRLGRFLTDGSSHILPFISSGTTNVKFIQMQTPVNLLTAGSATTFTAVNAKIGAPGGVALNAAPIYLNTAFITSNLADTSSVRPSGSTATAGNCPLEVRGQVVSVTSKLSLVKILPGISSGNLSVDYIVGSAGTTTIGLDLAAFDEYL